MPTTVTQRVSGSPASSATVRVTGSLSEHLVNYISEAPAAVATDRVVGTPSTGATPYMTPTLAGLWTFRAQSFAALAFQCPLGLGFIGTPVGGATTVRVEGI